MSDKDFVGAEEHSGAKSVRLCGNCARKKEMLPEEKIWFDFIVKNFFDKRILHDIPTPSVSIVEYPRINNTVTIKTTDGKELKIRAIFCGTSLVELGFFVSAQTYKSINGECANAFDRTLHCLNKENGTIYFVRLISCSAKDMLIQKMSECNINLVCKVEVITAKEMFERAQQNKKEYQLTQIERC